MRKLLVGILTVAVMGLVWTASALAAPGWGLTGAGGVAAPGVDGDFNVSAHSDIGGADATGQMHLFLTNPQVSIDTRADVTCLDVIGTNRAGALGPLEHPVTLFGFTYDFGGISVTDNSGTNSPDTVAFWVSTTASQADCHYIATVGGFVPLQQGNVVIHNAGDTSESASDPFKPPADVQLYRLGSS